MLRLTRSSSARVAAYSRRLPAAPLAPLRGVPAASVRGFGVSAPSRDGATASATANVTEKVTGAAERHSFQAETRQLLNIVTHSLYTDKHVFVRELISNASDALEKLRHRQVAGDPTVDPELPLSIRITTDEAAKTIIFQDAGIGMDNSELIENLGTIARSGSRAFIQRLKDQGSTTEDMGSKIIGQFGVGFYSAFMVADSVQVFSKSAKPEAPAQCWTSAGDGSYELSPAEGVQRGTKIVIKLKDSCVEFASAATVKDVIRRYSNYVNFPIILNGEQVNTVQAIWTMNKSDVTEEQYTEFYKYKSGDFEAPLYRLHFNADAPIAMKALLFVGQTHEEKYGMGRVKPGVDLYSRKVLIEASSRVMPDWLRFVAGVVDSEDIPLNISRESMQDSALMKRLRSVITRRVLRFFEAEARRDPERYNKEFFHEFGNFLKEGAVTDAQYAPDIARLLRFESSRMPAGTLTSLDEYVSRMSPGQKEIYYLVAPHRGIAESSPYMEAFKGGAAGRAADQDVEVLFLYSPIDDFVMANLREHGGRKLVTAETADLDPESLTGVKTEDKAKEAAAEAAKPAAEEGAATKPLNEEQVKELGDWLLAKFPKKLSKVRATTRLRSSPAVVVDHESAAVRRMMRMVEQTAGRDSEALKAEAHMLPPQTLELNPSHPVVVRLHNARLGSPDLAFLAAEQMLDNALVAAGLVDDARTMLPRLNALLERLLRLEHGPAASSYTSAEDLASKRYVSKQEAKEAAEIEEGKRFYEKLDAELKAAKAAGEGGEGAEGADGRHPVPGVEVVAERK